VVEWIAGRDFATANATGLPYYAQGSVEMVVGSLRS
jgi:hypothetical protein